MHRGPHATPITLTDDERMKLADWSRRPTSAQRLALRAHVKTPAMQGGSGLSLEEIVKFEWAVALGELSLTLSELEALARLQSAQGNREEAAKSYPRLAALPGYQAPYALFLFRSGVPEAKLALKVVQGVTRSRRMGPMIAPLVVSFAVPRS